MPSDVTVTGLVEGLAGGYLSGWAIDPARPGPAEVTVTDAAGAVVAAALADRPRSDLSVYDFGRADFAFRIPIPTLGRSDALHVFADGAELTGSPLPTGSGRYDGVVSVHEGHAEGWVHARSLAFTPPTVRLYDQDGVCVGEAETWQPGGDPLFNPARFRVRLDARVYRFAELALRAEADGVVFATTLARLTTKGGLDRLDRDGASGWVMCLEAPSVRFDIDLRCDGDLLATTLADRPREELRAAFPDNWRIGFSFEFEEQPCPPAAPQVFSLRIHGCDVDLFEGPLIVGPARGLIATARGVARSIHTRTDLAPAERAVLQAALGEFIASFRADRRPLLRGAREDSGADGAMRLSVVIPVYRNVALTASCIDSVLAHRDPTSDALVLIDDASPDEGMAALLDSYAGLPHLHVLTNDANLGFVRTVNRGLDFCRGGDVILLNSDTRVFAGSLDALWRAAHGAPEIGSATALSNNATIFSYPFCNEGQAALDDVGWNEIAAAARAGNGDRVFDVPTGHGFCLLLRRELLDRAGGFDEVFGRGYGEENDYCLRSSDLGFRHVAAAGAFVEHRESVSFGGEKDALLRTNLAILDRRYPEYAADVCDFIARDGLRGARWAIDAHRLRRTEAEGARYVLVLGNWLGGGTRRAIDDIARLVGYRGAVPLDLSVTIEGRVELSCAAPRLRAVFLPGEYDALFRILDGVPIEVMLIHQLLGHETGFLAALDGWGRRLRRFYYLHDYYPLCPRVTLIDAGGNFCGVAPIEVCERCVDLAGVHDAARMNAIGPARHRALFAELLGGMDRVLVPSASAAATLAHGLPGLPVAIVPHPEPPGSFDVPGPAAIGPNVVLLGAIGPHKGSGLLLEVARRARLVAPALRFHVIGYTDIDRDLRETGNVAVFGHYRAEDLARLVADSGAGLALFLHRWPETYSYTLSEAVQLGLIPVVPDIGAPAERVRAAGYGYVFGFPIDPTEVVDALAGIIDGRIDPRPGGATPARFAAAPDPAYADGALLPSLARS